MKRNETKVNGYKMDRKAYKSKLERIYSDNVEFNKLNEAFIEIMRRFVSGRGEEVMIRFIIVLSFTMEWCVDRIGLNAEEYHLTRQIGANKFHAANSGMKVKSSYTSSMLN